MSRVDAEWEISAPRLRATAGGCRVEADINGARLWFESSDANLVASPEAYATLFFVPALLARARFRIDAPLDQEWLKSTAGVPPILSQWWGTPTTYPIDEPEAHEIPAGTTKLRALAFTAGVDSTYELVRAEAQIGALLFVHGFDIDIEDTQRMQAFEEPFREVGERLGKQTILVRTNARRHPLFGGFSWNRTHGAAIAAVGHIVSDSISQLRIASSWAYSNDQPWGSHWGLDTLWSGRRLQVEHADATYSRPEKIGLIADEPLAQNYLRVCWANKTATGNCGRCSKCVRTMLALHVHGVLDKYATFEHDVDLVERLDGVPYLKLHSSAKRQLEDLRDYPDLYAALSRLIERKPPGWLGRKLKRLWSRVGV